MWALTYSSLTIALFLDGLAVLWQVSASLGGWKSQWTSPLSCQARKAFPECFSHSGPAPLPIEEWEAGGEWREQFGTGGYHGVSIFHHIPNKKCEAGWNFHELPIWQSDEKHLCQYYPRDLHPSLGKSPRFLVMLTINGCGPWWLILLQHRQPGSLIKATKWDDWDEHWKGLPWLAAVAPLHGPNDAVPTNEERGMGLPWILQQ